MFISLEKPFIKVRSSKKARNSKRKRLSGRKGSLISSFKLPKYNEEKIDMKEDAINGNKITNTNTNTGEMMKNE